MPSADSEDAAGPTAIDSSLGNGGLTAGLTPEGTIAVLSWPNPSYFNQMNYLTLSRGDPNLGAAKNMGAFAGLDVSTANGRAFSWLRDWPSTQSYLSGTSDALVTTFSRNGVTLTQTAVVSTTADAMTIRDVVRSTATIDQVADAGDGMARTASTTAARIIRFCFQNGAADRIAYVFVAANPSMCTSSR